MLTWGYIKEATLAKMDLTLDAAIDQGLINKVVYYANEALTEITSTIKANKKYAEFKVHDKEYIKKLLKQMFNFNSIDFLDDGTPEYKLNESELQAKEIFDSYVYTGDIVKMPDDFVSWSNDINLQECDMGYIPIGDKAYLQRGNYIIFNDNCFEYRRPAIIKIAYNARWFLFTPTTDDDEELDIPDDILICLPSYIASQLFKIDDEQKSSIYRNEYEMALARINENDYATNKVINNGGDW